ncbi:MULTISPECIES: Hsp70 family protein [unclassified Streptomyces]|uniref:Hsp70 family protein n=1 Tax=unclassified Streptomyces TaxID=2593676 RepID=UPI00115FEE9D|nr:MULTISPECIES: Hsp70 family protein [unclassified Streptomyces]
MKKQKVAVAVDFGTHGTGYAWTIIDEVKSGNQRRDIHPRMQWPSHPIPYPKNLTALFFSEKGELQAWGYEARRQFNSRSAGDGTRYVNSFKMSLAPTSSKEPGRPELPSEAISSEEAKELVALYLKKIFQEAMAEITRSGFSEDEIRWCVTVPAIWGDYEKQLMREAAETAGLPKDPKRLLLAYEPEVAAHYARVSGVRTAKLTGKRANLLSPGSRFLVADCGGGTVDITAYRAISGDSLEEIGRECGGKFGSEYINRAFVEDILVSRFGSFDALDRIREQQPTAIIDLIDDWEKAKLHFAMGQNEEINIQISLALDRCLDESARAALAKSQDGFTDAIVISPDEARSAFEVVVPGILELVDRQLDEMKRQRRNARGKELIVLVGGFGNSPYLRSRLEQHLEGRAEVITPPDPQVAVLYGAVYFACNPQVRIRRARLTYGCNTSRTFRPRIDPPEFKFTGPENRDRCRNRFCVFVTHGQKVRVDEVVEHSLAPVWDTQRDIVIEVYGTRSVYPQYVTEQDCQKIGSVTVDLSNVMHLDLGERGVNVAMQFGETEIKVTATVKETGDVVQADLDFVPLS